MVRSIKDKQVLFRDKSIRAAITQVRFSPMSNKTLACSYSSGVIALWDMHAKVQKSKFMAHS